MQFKKCNDDEVSSPPWAQFCCEIVGGQVDVKPICCETYRENVGGHGILYPHCWKKWGTRPRVLYLIAPMITTVSLLSGLDPGFSN